MIDLAPTPSEISIPLKNWHCNNAINLYQVTQVDKKNDNLQAYSANLLSLTHQSESHHLMLIIPIIVQNNAPTYHDIHYASHRLDTRQDSHLYVIKDKEITHYKIIKSSHILSTILDDVLKHHREIINKKTHWHQGNSTIGIPTPMTKCVTLNSRYFPTVKAHIATAGNIVIPKDALTTHLPMLNYRQINIAHAVKKYIIIIKDTLDNVPIYVDDKDDKILWDNIRSFNNLEDSLHYIESIGVDPNSDYFNEISKLIQSNYIDS